ncbi:hypothetical protein COCCADRAFT_3285 [Bipolaris zeicola 26-R-13]|uniref:Uncharacterized protein n=1 Tax=Cochliobolus carbonum (strain 26-R-13) TaxID=930089 RepID=W6Y7A1_COCC2|nr:uncharacterized protein COCCADRAFT_3285 [Bipolaris zeicola 26-R-13]EUC35482.1 hypothetical protein COCCADRAFT_3285 [Bipolaris zeicola 26-R-13]
MSSGPSGSAPPKGKKRSRSEGSKLTTQPQPSSQSQKAPIQPKETIDLTMADEETSPTTTVSTGSRATSTEPPIKFSLRPVYGMIDLTLESDEDKDVIGGMHAKSNPAPKGKQKEVVVVKKKSEKEIKRAAQLDRIAITFTPAQAIAALANPKPRNITYDMQTGERFTYPVKRSYHLGAMGRYLPPAAGPASNDKASAAEKKGSTKGKAPAEGGRSTRDMAFDADN